VASGTRRQVIVAGPCVILFNEGPSNHADWIQEMNRPLRTVVIDADPASCHTLYDYLSRDHELSVRETCSDPGEALAHVNADTTDLLVLDTALPSTLGFQLLSRLRERPAVILISDGEATALRVFGFAPADNLRRPIEPDRLALAVQRAKAVLLGNTARDAGRSSDADVPVSGAARFAVRDGGRLLFIPVGEIRWIESSRNYLQLHTAVRTHTVRMKISAAEAVLSPVFVRIHRRLLVNLEYVISLTPGRGADYGVQLADGTVLRLSRTHRESLLTAAVINAPRYGQASAG
jgi:two-component system, LytTR family, response regulator